MELTANPSAEITEQVSGILEEGLSINEKRILHPFRNSFWCVSGPQQG